MGNPDRPDINDQEEFDTILENDLKRPARYKVLLLNDDYTTMDFVILVLKKFFHKTAEESERLMFKVHQEGAAVCGVYTYEVAESKVFKVNKFAREHGHPLKCTMEAE